MAYTSQEVAAYIAANPQLSGADILALAKSNGVDAPVLFDAINVDGGRFSGVNYDQLASAYSNAPAAQPQPQPQGQATTPAPVANTAAAGAGATYTPGQITDAQLQTFFTNNPGLPDSQIYAMMRQYGVAPEQVSRAIGMPLDQAQNRFREARVGATPTGLVGAEESFEKGLADATGTLRGAETQSLSDIDAALKRVVDLYGLNIDELRTAGTAAGNYFQPYYAGGTKAFDVQTALSGALGVDAFNKARQESPYEKFLFEQGMRGNLAGAAATGGLGGGNIQKELQRFGQGLASQGLQQQIGNLDVLSGKGFQAAGALGDITLNTAGNVAGQRTNIANAQGTAGLNRANIAQNTGQNIANMQYGTGQDIGAGRARAGEIQANQLQNFYANQSNLLSGMGAYNANLIGDQTSNLIGMGGDAATRAASLATGLSREVSGLQTGLAGDQNQIYQGMERINAPSFDYGSAFDAAAGGYNLGGQIVNAPRAGGPAPVSTSTPTSSRFGPYNMNSGGYVPAQPGRVAGANYNAGIGRFY
jgi:hypothetical protein